jgi:hypothetical protein
MNLEQFIKYLIWVVFLVVALIGLYFLLTRLGAM